MNSKIYLFIGILLISLVSAEITREDTTQDKLRDKDYQKDIREEGVTRENNGESILSFDRTYLSYDPETKEILIEDWKFGNIFKGELEGEYKKYVSVGNLSEVGRFNLTDFDRGKDNLFNNIKNYDTRYDYREYSKTVVLEYGVNYINTRCKEEISEEERIIIICEDSIETNWTVFTKPSELPFKNIMIRILVDMNLGEEGEWVMEIGGHSIIAWAEYFVGFGQSFEYDSTASEYNDLIHLRGDYFVNLYSGVGDDGQIVLLKIDLTSNTVIEVDSFEFDTGFARHISGIRDEILESDILDDTAHVIVVYEDTGGRHRMRSLGIDLDAENIFGIQTFTLDSQASSDAIYNSIARIDEDNYAFTFRYGSSDDGYIQAVKVSATWIISGKSNKFRFDTSVVSYNSLVRVNETLFLNAYSDSVNDGQLVLLRYNHSANTFSLASPKFEFEPGQTSWKTLLQMNETHYAMLWRDISLNGQMAVFEINSTLGISMVSSGFSNIGQFQEGTMTLVNKTRYAISRKGVDSDGFFQIVDLNETGFTFTTFLIGEFNTRRTGFNQILQIGNNTNGTVYFLGTHEADSGRRGTAKIFFYEPESCTPPISGNWNLKCYHNCVFDSDISFTENITISGIGVLDFNANFTMEIGNYIAVEDSCKFVSGGTGVNIQAA